MCLSYFPFLVLVLHYVYERFPFTGIFSIVYSPQNGTAKVILFFILASFFEKIFSLFLSSLFPSKDISYPLTPDSHPLYELPHELGVQKYISFLFKQVFPISFFGKNVIYFLNI